MPGSVTSPNLSLRCDRYLRRSATIGLGNVVSGCLHYVLSVTFGQLLQRRDDFFSCDDQLLVLVDPELGQLLGNGFFPTCGIRPLLKFTDCLNGSALAPY